MSACIYHDADAVAVCPGCDFGVCQECMDGGTEGVCSTCAEERDLRKQHSAVQREYTVEEQVARCNYCRAAADDETPLDEQGYCPTCTSLARCSLHNDLIAVGHCKSCRQEFCRKCLGFTDVCQACTAKNKNKPPRPAPPPPAARSAAGKKKSAVGTAPMKEPSVASGRSKSGTAPIREKSGVGGARGTAELGKGEKGGKDGKGAKKKRAQTRGELAMEAKMAAKNPGHARTRMMAIAGIGAVVFLALTTAIWARVSSPNEHAKQLQDQMLTVHRGVMHYYKQHGTLPENSSQIYAALGDLHVANPKKIQLAVMKSQRHAGGAPPDSVVFIPLGAGFEVAAADHAGNFITDERGTLLALDQSYDSSSH